MFFVFLVSAFSILSVSLLLQKINNIQRFGALKQMLHNSNIESNDEDFDILPLVIFLTIFLFLGLSTGFYLAVKSDIYLFVIGITSVVFSFLAFLKFTRLYYKIFGSVYVGLFLGTGLFIAAISLGKIPIDTNVIFSSISLGILAFLPPAIEDLQKINTDFKDDKTTLANTLGFINFRIILISLFIILYIIQIILVVSSLNVWYFIPLFSGTLAAHIILKLFSKYGSELEKVVNLSIGFAFFHALLVCISLVNK
ncbi:hypothetical protein OAQ99_02495 [Candidatus Kapabacteria bacterium]|nr:hypothetical protein [Candidatus Kapabacteria bacterium]